MHDPRDPGSRVHPRGARVARSEGAAKRAGRRSCRGTPRGRQARFAPAHVEPEVHRVCCEKRAKGRKSGQGRATGLFQGRCGDCHDTRGSTGIGQAGLVFACRAIQSAQGALGPGVCEEEHGGGCGATRRHARHDRAAPPGRGGAQGGPEQRGRATRRGEPHARGKTDPRGSRRDGSVCGS